MIRTELVTLTSIPATAYRQKLPAGGSGIVILRDDSAQPGIASISKTSGEPIPTRNTPAKLFPKKAFQEAMELTVGLPYRKRGMPTSPAAPETPAAEPEVEAVLEEVVDGKDYAKIVDTYLDKTGKLSYALLNKDLIAFAHRSSRVRAMIDGGASEDELRLYIVGTKFRNITGNRNLTDGQVLRTAELLDEVSPKGVFRELNDELRKKLKK
ncbi:MAG: hypothetical protein IKQ92_07100 [Clostridia bacterium]|nr:hypothetical protein [Clostridia bacterium]